MAIRAPTAEPEATRAVEMGADDATCAGEATSAGDAPRMDVAPRVDAKGAMLLQSPGGPAAVMLVLSVAVTWIVDRKVAVLLQHAQACALPSKEVFRELLQRPRGAAATVPLPKAAVRQGRLLQVRRRLAKLRCDLCSDRFLGQKLLERGSEDSFGVANAVEQHCRGVPGPTQSAAPHHGALHARRRPAQTGGSDVIHGASLLVQKCFDIWGLQPLLLSAPRAICLPTFSCGLWLLLGVRWHLPHHPHILVTKTTPGMGQCFAIPRRVPQLAVVGGGAPQR
eukprot:CAMPEP_0183591126 /NCGR_PEP_ID=MMETSP0371-20130417/165694_1 /TAXON_ID=268820 /ORGANISM="Peridinium aciculiferum, Strain PAER-2" /LENGTH=280 /DNA_ID=CAMNT_0025802581 /DNA_START=39 /DNA_END=882 /DNA_ORIENTATION=+